MLEILAALFAMLMATIGYYIIDLMNKRKQIQGLPQPPMSSLLLGHLPIAAECQKLFPEQHHPQCVTEYIRTKYNLPEIFYIDWRPFGSLFLFVADPQVTTDFVVGQNLPKAIGMVDYITRFLGKNSLIILERSHWKSVRGMFNQGFATSNLADLTDYMVDAGVVFRDILLEKAASNELFELEELATRLTIDIIGRVTLDVDMNSQRVAHPIGHFFRQRVRLMPKAEAVFPWQDVDLLRPLKMWWNGRQLQAALNEALDSKIIRRAKESESGQHRRRNRSVIDLALAAYEKETSMSGIYGENKAAKIVKPSDIPSSLRHDIVDSVKTFFFAGHDTSSSAICWALYLLHRNPKAHAEVKAEMDAVFPPGTDAAEAIKADPYLINKLEYTTAVIKEALRIFPPASTLREVDPAYPPKHTTITQPGTGIQFPMDLPSTTIWPLAYIMHRNPRFFPKPTHFIPERFIQSRTPFPDSELFTPAGRDAFRAFERGPRNCIGQELAMMEIRIVLALVVRDLDFVLEYPGEEPDIQYPVPDSMAQEFSEDTEYGRSIRNGGKRDRIEGHRVFQILEGTAKPFGRCPGRIYRKVSS